ncbi:hypothetical protein COT72_05140 [archaeon CG10_big_fil_rev_8_21_14_0_10_43_11]|nr:MAG: hypothetical protein COT72_05140 [archaeon CG10_big_fil_rev_8_21_14_0_10_43_11]
MRIEATLEYVPKNVQNILVAQGITELRPPQARALEAGLFEKNLVIASPTASGKTLIAEMDILNMVLNKDKKAVYLVPLRSLASEKYADFKKKYKDILDVSVSMGDLDSKDTFLKHADIIIATSEKMDSLLRHGAPWLSQVGLLVVDEVHLLGEEARGPTLEVLLTRLKTALPKLKILALSATIKNAHEIGKWLSADIVESTYRPVELKEGIMFDNCIDFFDNNTLFVSARRNEPSLDVVHHTHEQGKQSLVFVSSRRSAETFAQKIKLILSEEQSKKLAALSQRVQNVLEKPTSQCEKLATFVKNGVAFHHAGLLNEQRTLLENAFRDGTLSVIVATPTLAMGVDLPAFRVIVKDLKRYYAREGFMDWIKVLEYKQLAGRAGRPNYEKWGEAITFATTREEKELICSKFVQGEVEEVYSKLSHQPTLRMHALALIAQEVITGEESAQAFFEQTFYATQYGNLDQLQATLRMVLDELQGFGFITYQGSTISATRLGLRVAQLYLDPISAHTLLQAIEATKGAREVEPIALLHAICMTLEMQPSLRLSRTDYSRLAENFEYDQNKLLYPVPPPTSFDFEDYIRAYKTALLLEDWIDEITEQGILTKFRVLPGDLRWRVNNADWILYSLAELARVQGATYLLSPIQHVRIRITYGIKVQLLPLVQYAGIGRVRARTLYDAGIRTAVQIKSVPLPDLERLLGPKIATKLKLQVSEKTPQRPQNEQEPQSDLNKYVG